MAGFITLHRKIVDWEWYTDIPVKILFIHLILTANYEDKPFQGSVIKRGQRRAGRFQLAEETGLTPKQVWRAMEILKQSGEIRTKTRDKRYTTITVVKYSDYQVKRKKQVQEQGQQRDNKGTPSNKETIKTERENRANRFKPPTETEAKAYFVEKGSDEGQATTFWNFYESKGWMVGKNKMKRWHNAASGWISRNRGGTNGDGRRKTDKTAAERYLEEFGSGSSAQGEGICDEMEHAVSQRDARSRDHRPN